MNGRYTVQLSGQAKKDVEKLTPKLRSKLQEILLRVLAVDPRQGKRLSGDLKGYWSYRLTYKDRILYRIFDNQHLVFVDRARTHYGD